MKQTKKALMCRPLSRVIRVLYQRCGVRSSAVIGIESKKERRKDSALRRAFGSRCRGRQSILQMNRLRAVYKKADDPENKFGMDIIAEKF